MLAAIDAIKGGEMFFFAAKQKCSSLLLNNLVYHNRLLVIEWQSCSWHETRTKAVSNVCRTYVFFFRLLSSPGADRDHGLPLFFTRGGMTQIVSCKHQNGQNE